MVINETSQAVIDTTLAQAYVPSLIILAVLSISSFALITWCVKGTRKWGDMVNILIYSVIVVTIITIGLILLPETVGNFINWSKSLLGA